MISRIHTLSGHIRSNLNPDFRIHDPGVSLGDGSENSTSVKQSSMQIYWSCHIFSRSCVTKHLIMKKKIQVIIPFHIFEKFSPKVQTEALTRQDNFVCVPFLQFRDQILLIVNANSEFT